MDVSLFLNSAPGRLVPIDGGETSFVPDPLPPKWKFPEHFWPLLLKARMQISLLEGIGRDLPNPGILLRPLEDREALQSSRLEGTYATPRELLLYELEPREAKPGDERVSDWREVYNYRKALLFATHSELPLSLRLIREMHRILMTGVRGKDKTPGEFRKCQVAIGANRRFVPPPHLEVQQCLDAFEKAVHADAEYDPLVHCFLCHYQFETIHPFTDGNGRVGRLLLALMIQQRCELTKPWIYLSEYFESRKEEYCQTLFDVSTRGNWADWIEFCLKGALEQAQATVARCERLRQIRETYVQRLSSIKGSIRLAQIVEALFTSPFLRITDVRDRLNVTYPTAKSDIDKLVEAGILREVPHAGPATYYAPEVFNAGYEGLDNNLGD